MSRRSAEEDTLTELNHQINTLLSNNLDAFSGAVVAQFVLALTVNGIMTTHGLSNYAKASRIMDAVRATITIQASPERITQRFDEFVLLLNNLGFADLAHLLVDTIRKCA